MFIGHFALGFAAKRLVPQVQLAALFGAAQLADLLWPVLLATGIEQVRIDPGNTASTPLDFVSYPYSHSLVTLIVWGIVFGYAMSSSASSASPPQKKTVFWVILALVVSHWLLDFVTHRPDLPLYPGGPKFGLGLWNFPVFEKAVEIALYAIGLWIYLRATTARDGTGRWALWGLAAFLFAGFLASSAPPPSITALWSTALVVGGLIVAWTYWADRHRVAR
jgi:hypothetical protein